jgi:hypothetical protein
MFPRDASEHEAQMLLSAVRTKDSDRVARIFNAYSNVLWGNVNERMSPEEQEFVRKSVTPAPSSRDMDDW